MTCYVDEIRHYPGHRSGREEWCHLVTDGEEAELHDFAARLGLRREWYQSRARHPHYDLPPERRAVAIALGALPISSREMIRLLRRRRELELEVEARRSTGPA